MTYLEMLQTASKELTNLKGRVLDILDVKKPMSIESAIQLSKVISKLSPLMGNMIEFNTVDLLNTYNWGVNGKWIRQDPGFPDALFQSSDIIPNIGVEIKAWFPLATEITARFKDSVNIFSENNINVALIAWLPEHIIWGKPKIIDVLVVSGKSVAEARDKHYHNPPYYLVLEPEDTTDRTGNLQQTNTNGYRIQDDKCDVKAAKTFVDSLGEDFRTYKSDAEYQKKVKNLQSRFVYRLDTNFAKIDRIEHNDIETFKTNINATTFEGHTIKEWSRLLSEDTSIETLTSEIQKCLLV